MYQAIITAPVPSALFEQEARQMKNDRASYHIKKTKANTKFIITAKDAHSFRATVQSITKLFVVYEKMKAL